MALAREVRGPQPTAWGRFAQSPLQRWLRATVLARPAVRLFLLSAIPLTWLALTHLGPLLQMARISLLDAYPLTVGQEPVTTLRHYQSFFTEPIYLAPFVRTLVFATVITATTLVVVYPVAYFIAKHAPRSAQIRLLLLLLVPFWVSYIIRTFAFIVVLGNRGFLNLVLMKLGLTELPIPFMYTYFSLGMGVLYLTVLYMLLPLYAAIEKVDDHLLQAAADLGAGPWTRFRKITLPLTKDGIASGCTLVFLLSTGYYAVPLLLGGPNTTLFAETIGNFFSVAGDRWPVGAAFAILMLATSLALVFTFVRLLGSRGASLLK